MNVEKKVIAVDLGASSGRLTSGVFDGEKITLKEQFRFTNLPVRVADDLYWDHMRILQSIKEGLNAANRDLAHIDSLSVDTWGVDYGLIDQHHQLLMAPHSYRDSRVDQYVAEFYQRIAPFELFQLTGNQPANINSILQLFADLQIRPYLQAEIKHVLFMPSLIEYLLSGKLKNEFTISSSSGLLDTHTREFSAPVLKRLGFKPEWFGSLAKGGQVLGNIRPEIASEMHLLDSIRVVAGAGHDTAAALLALPLDASQRASSAFISCGTWSIVGRQTSAPIVTRAAYEAGLTNEGCFKGGNRILKNITGLWILQELQREWAYQGDKIGFGEMVELAAKADASVSYIDVNASVFSQPTLMEEKIISALKATHQALPKSRAELIRLVIESLAFAYRQVIEELEAVAATPIRRINMFGGGIQNQLLLQLTADFSEREVVAGPVEASVLGNVVSQLQANQWLDDESVATVLQNSYKKHLIQPKHSDNLNQRYLNYQKIIRENLTIK